ncbi:MAG TPA: hypothetical protein VM348_04845 [Brevundimonas sp.]|nr:hypothetical protein [Brevundimonas sp.]
MQALIEFIAGFIALLAAAVLSQFGVDMNTPRHNDREVHRLQNCGQTRPAAAVFVSDAPRDKNC